MKNRSHTITAQVEIPQGGGAGVILAQGGRFAGWSLYMKDGRVSYVHNWVGKERYTITAPEPLAPGKATIRYEFAYAGGKHWFGRYGNHLCEWAEGGRGSDRKHHAVPLFC